MTNFRFMMWVSDARANIIFNANWCILGICPQTLMGEKRIKLAHLPDTSLPNNFDKIKLGSYCPMLYYRNF